MSIWNRPSRALVLGTLWILAPIVTACDSTTEPAGEERRLGVIIGFENDDPQIVIPNTVQAGVEFVVEVTTYGGVCDRKGETEVASSATRATITVYDHFKIGACMDPLVSFVHQATVEFSEPGLATVVIQGRSGGNLDHEAVEIEREVEVLEQQASN